MLKIINEVRLVLKKITFILDKSQKRMLVAVYCVIVGGSFIELLGVSAILPFIQAIISPQSLLDKKYVGDILHFLNVNSDREIIITTALILIIIYLIKNIYLILSSLAQSFFSARVISELSVKMLNSYLSKPYTFFLEANSAEILRGCQGDISATYYIMNKLMTLSAEILTCIAICGFIIVTDPFIALQTIILMLLVLTIIIYIFKPLVKNAGKKNVEIATKKNKVIVQIVLGIKDIFVLNRKELFLNEYKKISEEERRVQRVYSALSNFPDRIVEGLCVSGIIGIICLKLIFLPENMNDFVPKIAAFALAAFRVLPSIGKITTRINDIVYYTPGFENIYNNMKESSTVNDIAIADYNQTINSIIFKNEIQVKNVSWKYDGNNEIILKDANLMIHKGETIALIGHSGAGKTTLSDIILGLLRPQSGMVEIDGVDIHTIPNIWSELVGYVPQNVYLIDDTIRNNVLFGIDNNTYTDSLIWDALNRAQIGAFVRKLPKQLDTIIGERGVKLSGGQRQRIALARALVNKPQILVLDEATSSLDNETERAVMKAIDSLHGSVTMIIVAHRLSTIRNSDRVYEVKNGNICEIKKETIV